MANRIVGNLVIIDSQGISIPYLKHNILAAGFYGADTTARMTLVYISDTRDSIIAFAPNGQNLTPWTDHKPLGGFTMADTMTVLLLTAGTGWLYLG